MKDKEPNLRHEPWPPYAELRVQAIYTLPELARAASMSRGRMTRLLDQLGVNKLRSGRTWLVPLSELKTKAAPLYHSITEAEHLRTLHGVLGGK